MLPPIRLHLLMISHKYSVKDFGEGGAALATDIMQPRQRTPIVGRKFPQFPKIQGFQEKPSYPGNLFGALDVLHLLEFSDCLDFKMSRVSCIL